MEYANKFHPAAAVGNASMEAQGPQIRKQATMLALLDDFSKALGVACNNAGRIDNAVDRFLGAAPTTADKTLTEPNEGAPITAQLNYKLQELIRLGDFLGHIAERLDNTL